MGVRRMFIGALFWFVPFLLLGSLIFGGIAVGSRREPDPTGRRVYAIYLLSVVFLAILASLVSVAGIGAKTVDLIVYDSGATSGEGGSFSGGTEDCVTDSSGMMTCTSGMEGGGFIGLDSQGYDRSTQDRSELVAYVVVLVIALPLLVWHANRVGELRRDGTLSSGVVRSTYSTYVYIVCFTGLAIAVTAAITLLLAIGDAAFPDDLGGGPSDLVRDAAYSQIASSVLGGAAAFMVLRYHWREGRGLRDRTESPPPEPVLT